MKQILFEDQPTNVIPLSQLETVGGMLIGVEFNSGARGFLIRIKDKEYAIQNITPICLSASLITRQTYKELLEELRHDINKAYIFDTKTDLWKFLKP